ncbi:hypothetical protein L6164_015478 [Bauhinia variegata]|uniref:Uncharacterized protein n=1 Tax=Bauhinia variegata TaxID=167791 RepID=A0ACB9NM19_BAUVA|nr:hypothetical protein L6164_015478 [Bauhinia variegata]
MGSSKTATGVTDDDATETDSLSATSANSSRTQTDNEFHNDTVNHSSSPLDSPPYAQGEKVLAHHNTRVYEAKVLRIENKQKEWRFYVHYLGWKKSWDEWVGVDRLMKYTEENLQKKRDLNEKHGNDKNPKAARASQIKSKSSNVARGRKRKSEPIIKETATIHSDKLVNIQIPPTLRKQLVDDCVFVTHLGKLVKLPRSPNVNDVFNKYLDYILKKDGSIADSVDEILKGLRSYFDKALPVILLYKNERHQYQEACLDDISPSTVYGAEHLLRLFVKLPELLLHADIEEGTLIELQAKLTDFLKFLQKNQSSFFLSTYHVPEDIENSTNKQDD